ncbi:MAG: Modification methylase HaeIII [Syntrophomonadaceae bacterium]|nr:Modification methylase HaeIII [Bacillota bacterium]MBT9148580.1 Modification methylase HaeIII [Bacillota bacterium]
MYPVISLFSGAMGLDLGLEAAGLEIRVSQDIDPWCCRTMEVNGKKYVSGNIRDLLKEDPDCKNLLNKSGLLPGEAFLVAGGPPCQPFSTAGRRLSTGDPRGSLFKDFCYVIKKTRPRFFVMENVKGLLSIAIKHRPPDNRIKPLTEEDLPGSAFCVIKKEFEELNYKLIYGVLDAVHYGVPQFRERLIIIGSRDHEGIFLPVPTHFPIHQNNNYRWKMLYEAIHDLEENPGVTGFFSSERLKYLRLIPQGGNWRNLPDELKPEAMGGPLSRVGERLVFIED